MFIIPLEKGIMIDGWNKEKCRRYMDWIENKWINKYRGWTLNCYDAIRSTTLSKEFGNRKKQNRNSRIHNLKERKRQDRREVYSILRDKGVMNKYNIERMLGLWVKLGKEAIHLHTKYRQERQENN